MVGVSSQIIAIVAGLAAVAFAALTGYLLWRRLAVSEAAALRSAKRIASLDSALVTAPLSCLSLGAAEQSIALERLSQWLGLAEGAIPDVKAVLGALEPTDRQALEQALAAFNDGTQETFDLELHCATGRYLRVTGQWSSPTSLQSRSTLLWFSDVTEVAQARAAAQDEAAAHAQLLDSLPLPVWRRDDALKLTYCNAAYARAVDRTRQEALAQGLELLGLQQASKSQGLARKALSEPTAIGETLHVVIEGERRLMALNEMALAPSADKEDAAEDAERANQGTAGWAIDCTDLEILEDNLNRHVAAHAEVLENLGSAIAIYGQDMRLKFFNHAYARLWQVDENDLAGEPHLSDVLELQREQRRLPEQSNFPAYKQERHKIYSTLIEPMEELQHLPNGSTLRMTVAPHPFGGVVFAFDDVTDRLALESSYNTLIAVQRETLNNLYEAVAVYGADGRLKLFNPGFMRIWNLAGGLLEAEPHVRDVVAATRAFFDVSDEEWPQLAEQKVAETTEPSANGGRLERADSSVIDWTQVPLPDGASLFTFLDVTDSIRVERALREHAEALETTDRLKSEFLANISYELRTPLNAIVGFAEILENKYFGELNDRQLEYAKAIVESSQRLLTLINDILDLATIEAGYLQLELAQVDLNELLGTIHTLGHERARSRGVELIIECPEDISTLMADERRLKQALFNLLSNALKFTPSGGKIVIAVAAADEEVTISVSDTGIGIPREQQTKVFDKFERGSGQGRQAGAGLGLSLVKSLIELHHGHITLDSTAHEGTSVVCHLPLEQPAPVAQIEGPDLDDPNQDPDLGEAAASA